MSDRPVQPPEAPAADGPDPFVGPDWIGRYALTSSGRARRVSARSRSRRRLQRRLGWLLLGLGTLMIVTAGWIVVTGLLARSQLTAMKSELRELRSSVSAGNVAGADRAATALARHAHRAHDLTSGPAWWASAALPGVGEPVRTVRGISAGADALGHQTLAQLVEVSSAIDPKALVLKNHTIDAGALIKATPRLDAAVAIADEQRRAIAKLPRHTWLTSVNQSAAQVDDELTELTGSLQRLDQVAHAAPTMLGYSGAQRYFVAFQNEAESRGTGGLPGAFGILVADHGKLSFTTFATDSELDGTSSGLALNAQYSQAWLSFGPTQQYLNSDVDPDFSYAGQIWAAMWQKKSGQHVDGAISLDPTALSYLLAVTGPAHLPDGSTVSAGNIVALTQSTIYAKYPTDESARKAYLLSIAQTVDHRLLAGSGDSAKLYSAAKKAVDERRLLMWSSSAPIESLLRGSPIAGAVTDTKAPYVGPVVIDYSANKLDYYLASSTTWSSSSCGPTSSVTVTIKLTNRAPANLPAYVVRRSDDPAYPVAPGDNRVLLYYIGTAGGVLQKMTIGSQVVKPRIGVDGSHPTFAELVELPRGKTQTIVLQLREPGSPATPVVLRQPMVIPGVITTRTATC